MSSRLLSFSLALNLVLLGLVGYWAVRSQRGDSSPEATVPTPQTNRVITRSLRSAPTPEVPSASTAFRWNEIESEDYPTYIANLREAGCPEPVLRRIIEAEVKELYAQKGFALAGDFHRDFWKIAARENIQGYFEKTLGQQVKALSKECDTLLTELIGETAAEPSNSQPAKTPESRLTDFLSPAKQAQLRWLAERYEERMQAVRQSNISAEEEEFQLAQLRREMESEQAQSLSPQEWEEYRLRQSAAANELQQLHGVDFSGTELRNLAKVIDEYHRLTQSEAETDPETLEQKLQSVLGPERFADLNRARSASYRELYEVATEFGRPPETAAEIFDLRLASEKQSDEIRADKNRTTAEKQALLDQLHDQVEQTVITKFGAGAYQSYKANGGRWIHSLGRL